MVFGSRMDGEASADAMEQRGFRNIWHDLRLNTEFTVLQSILVSSTFTSVVDVILVLGATFLRSGHGLVSER
jgi:hypothetical protein